MDSVELVRELYNNFAEGNVPEVLAKFDPAIEWYECEGIPYAPDGLYVGPNAVLNGVLAKIPEAMDNFRVDIEELFANSDGDRVVMVGYYRGIWKETGKEFKANATHTWTVKDGKLTRFFQAVDTAEMISP